MIYWFSGTGNSKYIADKIADANSLELASIAETMRGKNTQTKGDKVVGIVFPIYAWAPPKMVTDFIRSHNFDDDAYTFVVCSCGDDTGYAMSRLEKALNRKVDIAYSINMPNNYILGFDVDPKDLEAKKLAEADTKIAEINKAIASRSKGISDVNIGTKPWLKTMIASPMFNKFMMNTKSFLADDKCNSCGICAKSCPTANITVSGKPTWGNNCTMCLSCIHRCPTKAIQYGEGTVKKGRFVNPNSKVGYDFGAGK